MPALFRHLRRQDEKKALSRSQGRRAAARAEMHDAPSTLTKRQDTLLLCRALSDDLARGQERLQATEKAFHKGKFGKGCEAAVLDHINHMTQQNEQFEEALTLCQTISGKFPVPPGQRARMSQEVDDPFDEGPEPPCPPGMERDPPVLNVRTCRREGDWSPCFPSDQPY